jgi:hypothetical protein
MITITVSDGSLTASDSFLLIVGHTYRDAFDTVAYTGTNGTEDWSSQSWVEVGDNNNPATGDIRVSSNYLLIAGTTSNPPDEAIRRTADISGAITVTLSFDYRRISLESGDLITVGVSYDGGLTWEILDNTTFRSGNDGSWQSASYGLDSGQASNQTVIIFQVANILEGGDQLRIDNVEIWFLPPGGTTASAAQPLMARPTTPLPDHRLAQRAAALRRERPRLPLPGLPSSGRSPPPLNPSTDKRTNEQINGSAL